MGGTATSPKVFDYLCGNPKRALSVETIAKGTNLTAEQVRSAVRNLRKNHPDLADAIQVLQRGQAWKYDPDQNPNHVSDEVMNAAPQVGALFELIGYGEDDALVLRSGDHRMYVARPARVH